MPYRLFFIPPILFQTFFNILEHFYILCISLLRIELTTLSIIGSINLSYASFHLFIRYTSFSMKNLFLLEGKQAIYVFAPVVDSKVATSFHTLLGTGQEDFHQSVKRFYLILLEVVLGNNDITFSNNRSLNITL